MSKFIEITVRSCNEKVLVNLDNVEQIEPIDNGCILYNSHVNYAEPEDGQDYVIAAESYETIRHMIAVAQGGIPMHPSVTKEGAAG